MERPRRFAKLLRLAEPGERVALLPSLPFRHEVVVDQTGKWTWATRVSMMCSDLGHGPHP